MTLVVDLINEIAKTTKAIENLSKKDLSKRINKERLEKEINRQMSILIEYADKLL